MGITAQGGADNLLSSYMEPTKKLEMTQRESEKLPSADFTSSEKKPESTDLNSIERLIERLSKSAADRMRFVDSHINKGIAYQIRALRDRQNLSQEELAELVGMNQNAISRLESPQRGRPTITTLKRLATAFDVGLVVQFVPFSKLAKWYSGTPYVERGLCTDSIAVPDFDEELETGVFADQAL